MEKIKVITTNRKARHNYHILETIEAGIVLEGTEVKSLRQGKASLSDAYATFENGELWLKQAHIPEYKEASRFNHDPKRKRKLLLHKSEMRKLYGKVAEKGLTLIPLKMYFKGPYAKVELGLCRGKKKIDKREAIKKREALLQMERSLRRRKY